MKPTLQIICCNLIHALPERAHLLLRLNHHGPPVRFESLGLYPLSQKVSSIICYLLARPSQMRPYTKSPRSLPSSLPVSCLAIDQPPLSVYHHQSTKLALWPFTMSNAPLLTVALGVAILRTPDHRINLHLRIHSVIPISRLRGGYLSKRLLRKVRRRRGRTVLPAHLLACLGYPSSRAIHRQTGHVALFDGLHLTPRIMLRCPCLDHPGLQARPLPRKCAVGQKSLNLRESLI
jgi:hypothetical protein